MQYGAVASAHSSVFAHTHHPPDEQLPPCAELAHSGDDAAGVHALSMLLPLLPVQAYGQPWPFGNAAPQGGPDWAER